jgi:diguanylate cyclase (GGDEF)-like protein
VNVSSRVLDAVNAIRDELDSDHVLEVREWASAKRLLIVLLYSTVVLTCGFAILSQLVTVSATPTWWFGVPVGTLAAAVWFHRNPPPARSATWVVAPVVASTSLAALNIATNDASAAAQVFMCLPVLFAATHLHAPAAGIVTVFSVLANAVVAFTVLPAASAITDTIYVGALLLAMSAVLVRAGRRQDELVSRLRELATIDPLTGLVTRRAFNDRARAALQRRPVGDGTALIVLDIDRFKDINDTYGHVVGDDVLVHVARILASNTRVDSVLSRLGGDEIAVLLPRCTHESACKRAEDLVEAVRKSPLLESAAGHPVELTVSVGVAHAPEDGLHLRDLYGAADEALYRAKRAGRDRVGLSPSFSSPDEQRTGEPASTSGS